VRLGSFAVCEPALNLLKEKAVMVLVALVVTCKLALRSS